MCRNFFEFSRGICKLYGIWVALDLVAIRGHAALCTEAVTSHYTLLCFSRALHSSCVVQKPEVQSSQFVVCGAGAGGLAVASRLGRKFGDGKVTIVEPAEVSCRD